MKPLYFLSLVGLSMAIAGCNSNSGNSANNSTASSGGAGASASTVTIISPHNREIQTEFETLWKTKNPDISINWLDQGGSSKALNYVRNQYATNGKEKGIGADLFFGGGTETFTELEDDGLLKPLDSAYGIPEKLNGMPLVGKDKSWVAAALSGFGILYNKQIATRDKLPVPTTWEGLTDPKLKGRISLADPRQSGSAHTAYEIILQSNGWDKGWKILTAMAGNAESFVENSAKPLQNVQTGQAVFCPSIDFYALKAIAISGSEKLGYIEPKGQFVVTADPIAMLPGGTNPEGAKKFVDFVMSKEGQNLWFLEKGTAGGPKTESLYRLPAIPSAYKPIPKGANAKIDPYSQSNSATYDADKAAMRRRALDVLIGKTLCDNLEAIKSAWGKNPNLDATGFVPLSEADFMKIAAKWNDPEVVAENEEKWGAASEARFK